MNVYKGTLTAATSTGNVGYTGVGFQPKAIIFWGTRLTASGYGAGSGHFIGVATGATQEWCIAGMADDGAGTVVSGRYFNSSACIHILATGAPTTDAVADLVSFDSDGFTLNWSDASPSAFIVHYLALGGSDITSAKAGRFTPSTGTGNKSTTDPGFQPEFVMLAGIANAVDTLTAHDAVGIGFASSTTQEASVSWRDKDALGTSDVVTTQVTDKVLRAVTTSTGTANALDANLVSFDASGFTINMAVSQPQPIGYLALAGGDYYVGWDTQKTSTGTKATTGVGFLPAGVLALSWGLAASASADASNMRISVGGSDGTREGHLWFESDDNNTATDVDHRSVDTKFLGFSAQPSTTSAEADLTSMDSDGFTLDWTTADATAREFIFAAFGPGGRTETPNSATVAWTSPASTAQTSQVAPAPTVAWTSPAATERTTQVAPAPTTAWTSPAVSEMTSQVVPAPTAAWSVPTPIDARREDPTPAVTAWTSPAVTVATIMAASTGVAAWTSPDSSYFTGTIESPNAATVAWSQPQVTLASIMAASTGAVAWTQPTAIAQIAAQVTSAVVAWAQLVHTVVQPTGEAIVGMLYRRRRRRL